MTGNTEQDNRLRAIAKQVIEDLAAVAEAATSISAPSGSALNPHNILANPGSAWTGGTALTTVLTRSHAQKSADLAVLRREPFVAYVRFQDPNGNTDEIYVSRAMPLPHATRHTVKCASYRAPMSRVASVQAGDSVQIRLPRGAVEYTIVERSLLRPSRDGEGWDALDNQIEDWGGLICTVPSFRRLLAEAIAEENLDFLAELLEDGADSGAVFQGVRRQLIERMHLRDQPILDRYQDEIFRLPLDSRLLITGPPGTGKTTTLIKRLGLKSDFDFLDEGERDVVTRTWHGSGGHSSSWVMFTPTELLKQYVKEAFNKENIAAPDDRIRTWFDERRLLARNVLGILQSGAGGRFVLDESAPTLSPAAFEDSTDLFLAFEATFRDALGRTLRESASHLAANTDLKIADLGTLALRSLGGGLPSAGNIDALRRLGTIIGPELSDIRNKVLNGHREALNRLVRSDRELLPRLADLLERLGNPGAAGLEDDDTEDDDDIDEADLSPQATANRLRSAEVAYRRAIEALARATAAGRVLSKNGRPARIIAWLAVRIPQEEALRSLGDTLITIRHLRRLNNVVKLWIARVPSEFQKFRRAAAKENRFYLPEAIESFRRDRLVGLEVDAIVLLMLRNAQTLAARIRQNEIEEDASLQILRDIRERRRNQVVVDEATDFSPTQLGCMFLLTDPQIGSLFACGDFNQRITRWGTRDIEQFRWAVPDLDVRPIRVGYRQSRILAELAHEIAMLGSESAARSDVEIPERVESDGASPTLVEHTSGASLAYWLAQRITEVERQVGKLPSIAVFVDGDRAIAPLQVALADAVKEQNIKVVGCPEGRVIGLDGDVRIFDVQHIKGLEFEAVFFVDVDLLAARTPDLFDKYLYVGATRAATYLGLACVGNLPETLGHLRERFVADWAS